MPRVKLVLIFAFWLIGTSCQRPAQSGDLIDRYRTALCVEPSIAKGVQPATRGWDRRCVLRTGPSWQFVARIWSAGES